MTKFSFFLSYLLYLFRIFLYPPHFFFFPGTAIVFFSIIC